MNVAKNKLSSSPKEKPTKYETIFDHNITQEELEYLTSARSKEEYLKKYNYDLNACYRDLYRLYCDREDHVTAKKYFNMQSKEALKKYDDPNEIIHVTEVNGKFY